MQKYKKRSDGRYCKQIVIGYSADGKRKVKSIYAKTIRELEAKEVEIRHNINHGLFVENENTTVEEWALEWLKTYKNNVEPATYNMYNNSVTKHIVPSIGNIPLLKLRPIHIQQAINNLINEENYRTAEIYKLTVKQLIRRAVEEGLMSRDISGCIPAIKRKKDEKRVLTERELLCINKANLPDMEKLFLDILYYTGVRRGEALALDITDIDKENRMLRIDQSLDISNSKSALKIPKSSSSYREVPIPEPLFSNLMKYITKYKCFYLFTNSRGELFTASAFRRMWERILKELNNVNARIDENSNTMFKEIIDNISITPHIFRHTYATNLYYAGIKEKQMQNLLGHSDISITLSIYTHLDKVNSRMDAACKISDFFSQSSVSQSKKMLRYS